MTVAELMRALEAYNPEAEVLVFDSWSGVTDDINEVWRNDDGRVVIW